MTSDSASISTTLSIRTPCSLIGKRSASSALAGDSPKGKDEETFSPLAKKVCSVRKMTDKDSYEKACLQRHALQKCISILEWYPDLRNDCLLWLDKKRSDIAAPDESAVFDGSLVKRIEHFGKNWMKDFLLSLYPVAVMDRALVDAMDRSNPNVNIKGLFTMATSARFTTLVPKKMLEKRVASKALRFRAMERQFPMQVFVDRCVDRSTGDVNWQGPVPFELVWGEERVERIIHWSKDEIILKPHQFITREFSVVEPYDEMQCAAVFGKSYHNFADMFGEASSVKQFPMDKKGSELIPCVERASQFFSRMEMQQENGVVRTAAKAPPSEELIEKRREQAKMARKKAKELQQAATPLLSLEAPRVPAIRDEAAPDVD